MCFNAITFKWYIDYMTKKILRHTIDNYTKSKQISDNEMKILSYYAKQGGNFNVPSKSIVYKVPSGLLEYEYSNKSTVYEHTADFFLFKAIINSDVKLMSFLVTETNHLISENNFHGILFLFEKKESNIISDKESFSSLIRSLSNFDKYIITGDKSRDRIFNFIISLLKYWDSHENDMDVIVNSIEKIFIKSENDNNRYTIIKYLITHNHVNEKIKLHLFIRFEKYFPDNEGSDFKSLQCMLFFEIKCKINNNYSIYTEKRKNISVNMLMKMYEITIINTMKIDINMLNYYLPSMTKECIIQMIELNIKYSKAIIDITDFAYLFEFIDIEIIAYTKKLAAYKLFSFMIFINEGYVKLNTCSSEIKQFFVIFNELNFDMQFYLCESIYKIYHEPYSGTIFNKVLFIQ